MKFIPIIMALAFFIFGKLAHPYSAAPDGVITVSQIIGSALLFCYWLTGVYVWGRNLKRLISFERLGFGTVMGLGSGMICLFAMILGHLGLIGEGTEWIFNSGLVMGFLLDLYLAPRGTRLVFNQKIPDRRIFFSRIFSNLIPHGMFEWLGIVPWLVLIYMGSVLLIKAIHPQFDSDPLWYQLLGPRLWFQEGQITLSPRLPLLMRCSYWEYFSIWANAFLAESGGRGLVESQVFSQLVHLCLGWVGTICVLNELLAGLGISREKRGFAVLAGGASVFMVWTADLAKNDWGVVFWSLCGLRILLLGEDLNSGAVKWRSDGVAGIFLGMAVAAKYTSVIAIAPFVLGWVVFLAKRDGFKAAFKRSILLLFCGLIALCPILTRNYYSTGNPFYVQFNSIFKSPWLSASQEWFFSQSEFNAGAKFWLLVLKRLQLIALREPVLLILAGSFLVLVVLDWGKSKSCSVETHASVPFVASLRKWSFRRWVYGYSIVGMCLFFGAVGVTEFQEDGNLYLRLFGPGLVIGLAAGVLAGFDLISKISGKNSRYWGAVFGAFLVLFYVTKMEPYEFLGVSRTLGKIGTAVQLLPAGGMAKFWLRQNTLPDELIVSTGDNQFYYLSDYRITSAMDQPFLNEGLIRAAGSLPDYLKFLVSMRVRYLLDTQHVEAVYWSRFAYQLAIAVEKYPEAIVFEARGSRIVDPIRLLSKLSQSCQQASPFPQDPMALFL